MSILGDDDSFRGEGRSRLIMESTTEVADGIGKTDYRGTDPQVVVHADKFKSTRMTTGSFCFPYRQILELLDRWQLRHFQLGGPGRFRGHAVLVVEDVPYVLHLHRPQVRRKGGEQAETDLGRVGEKKWRRTISSCSWLVFRTVRVSALYRNELSGSGPGGAACIFRSGGANQLLT